MSRDELFEAVACVVDRLNAAGAMGSRLTMAILG